VCGITLAVLKFNGFDIWNLPRIPFNTILLSSSILFLLGIIILNTNNTQKIIQEKEVSEIVPTNSSVTTEYINSLSERTKYYLITIGISFFIGCYLGFKFKKFSNLYYLGRAAKKKAEWQRNTYLESITADDSFFTLTNYSFNWELFLLTIFILVLMVYLIRNTIYYEKIKDYIKSIKR
jgi:hypothetical protein